MTVNSTLKEEIVKFFDKDWYLTEYQDVVLALIDPLTHYLEHGFSEGRYPCYIEAVNIEKYIWNEHCEYYIKKLEKLVGLSENSPFESLYASWGLVRYFYSYGEWDKALKFLNIYKQSFFSDLIKTANLCAPSFLEFNILCKLGHYKELKNLIEGEIKKNKGINADYWLAIISFAQIQNSCSETVKKLNLLWQDYDLLKIEEHDVRKKMCLDDLHNFTFKKKNYEKKKFRFNDFYKKIKNCLKNRDLVSIIVPVYNAEKTISTALNSLLKQTWKDIEIIVVDDASSDKTANIVDDFISKTGNTTKVIRYLRHDYNQGAYAARNTGVSASSGKFITIHDSDDWSHPQKIEVQVKALFNNSDCIASVSFWARCSKDLVFHYMLKNIGFVYRNISSLMIRREVINKIGYWDRVLCNADTEYYYRIIKVYGINSIKEVFSGVPLSFGRVDDNSLTHNKATHLRTQFGGCRKDYIDAAKIWHNKAYDKGDLYLSVKPERRPFKAPDIMLPIVDLYRKLPLGNSFLDIQKAKAIVTDSALFDPDWYGFLYPDVLKNGFEPIDHYLEYGWKEEREVGPNFSCCSYKYNYKDISIGNFDPLLHYITIGKLINRKPFLSLSGAQKYNNNNNILLCSHTGGAEFYGAERSFLDILNGLAELGYNVFVCLPNVPCNEYLNQLRASSYKVIILPYIWWYFGRKVFYDIQKNFIKLIKKYGIDVLHINSTVLYEPLLAGRSCNIPTVVHARELYEYDPYLCKTLGGKALKIKQHVFNNCDYIIANSKCTQEYFRMKDKTFLVYNTFRGINYDNKTSLNQKSFIVTLLGSNIPKKGLYDFIEIAEVLSEKGLDIKLLLVGPNNKYIEKLKSKILPDNIVFCGYVKNPLETIVSSHVILNLSHFQESFGRTVLEAMLLKRTVICYDWGALPELVEHGKTGFLVPYKNTSQVVKYIIELYGNRKLLKEFGNEGYKRAVFKFGWSSYLQQLSKAYRYILAEKNC